MRNVTNVLLAGLALVLIAPVFTLFAIAIRLSGPGRVFVRQRSTLLFRVDNNVFGRWLHRTALDELPLLWQVLRGEKVLWLPARRSEGRASDAPTPDRWLKTTGYLIPRQYREPMLGDLIEDRKKMREAGINSFWIELVTAAQILVALAARPKLWASGILAWISRTLAS